MTSLTKRRLRTAILMAALALPMPGIAKDATVNDPAYDAQGALSFAGALLAGQTATMDNDLERAIAYFRRALQHKPYDIGTNNQLFITLIFNGDLKSAEAQAEKTSDEPQLVPLRDLALGLSALQDDRYAEAIPYFDAYSGAPLNDLISGLLTAWTLSGEGKTDEALELIDALSGPPWYDLFANYNAGAIAAAGGDTVRARAYFNEALLDREGARTAPDTILKTVIGLSELELKAGNIRKALDTVSTAETYGLNPAVLDPVRERIEAADPIEALPQTPVEGASNVLFEIAAALNQGGSDDVVSLYLALAEALTPDDPDVLYLRGLVANADDAPERALAYFSRIPEDAPQYRLAELQQGLALAGLDRLEEARAHLTTLVEAAPKDRTGYLALSGVYSQEENFQAMADVLDTAVKNIGPVAAPEDWGIFYRRGIAYERLKEWDKAEPNFKRALELYPNQPQVLNYLGYSWIDQGINLDEGLELIQQAVDQRPDDGYIIDSLGWAYYRLGRFDDAVRELERAVVLDTGNPTINDHLGDAYWQVGRKLEAIYQWNKALTGEPAVPDLVPKIKDKIANGLSEDADDTPIAKAAGEDGDAVKTP